MDTQTNENSGRTLSAQPQHGPTIFKVFECLVISCLLTLLITSGEYKYGSFGTVDFIEYWSAGQLWLVGQNPYDFEAMAQLQNQVGRQDQNAIMMWNPPWTLIFMAPLLTFSFLNAAKLWIAVNIVLIYFSANLICKTLGYNFKNGLLIPFTALLLFYPILSCLQWGQVGILLMLGVAVLLYSLNLRLDFQAGLSLCILTLKPHLFLLLGIALAFEIVLRKRFQILLGFLTGMGIIMVSSYIISPIGISTWISSLFPNNTISNGIEVTSWKVATLPGIIKIWGDNNQISLSKQLSWLATITGTLLYFGYRLKHKSEPNWQKDLIPILSLSFFIAPHGWPYDFSSLALGQLAILILAIKKSPSLTNLALIMGSFFSLSFSCLYLISVGFRSQHYYFIFPIAFLLAYNFGNRLVENTETH